MPPKKWRNWKESAYFDWQSFKFYLAVSSRQMYSVDAMISLYFLRSNMVILPCFSSPVHYNMPLSSPRQDRHFEEVLSRIMDRMHQTLIKSMNSAVARIRIQATLGFFCLTLGEESDQKTAYKTTFACGKTAVFWLLLQFVIYHSKLKQCLILV